VKSFFCCILTINVLLTFICPAHARDLEGTYPGDADETLYREISTAIFNYLSSYECKFTESTNLETYEKFRNKHKLDDTTPVIAGSCRFTGAICFAGRGVEVCFDHGGIMGIDRLKLRRKDTRAKAELSYFLADEEGKGAGVAFAFVDLKKEDAGWVAQKWQATGAIDFKAFGDGNTE